MTKKQAKPEHTCLADPNDPLAWSLVEQAERIRNCPACALSKVFGAGFSELREMEVKRRAPKARQTKRTMTMPKPNNLGLRVQPDYLGRPDRAYVRIVSGWVKRAHAVWVQHNGPIPSGRLIHHHDEDTLNDAIENLRCWTYLQHNRYHHGGAK